MNAQQKTGLVLVVKVFEIPPGWDYEANKIIVRHWEAVIVTGLDNFPAAWGVTREHAIQNLAGQLKAQGFSGTLRPLKDELAGPEVVNRAAAELPLPSAIPAPLPAPLPAPVVDEPGPEQFAGEGGEPEVTFKLWKELEGRRDLKLDRMDYAVAPDGTWDPSRSWMQLRAGDQVLVVKDFPWGSIRKASWKSDMVRLCKENRVFIADIVSQRAMAPA